MDHPDRETWIINKITGNQIQLRDMRVEDIEDYADWQNPGHAWKTLDAPYYPTQPISAERREEMRKRLTQEEHSNPPQRLIIANQHDDALIGSVSRYWISSETHWVAIGIVIFDPVHWNKGIGYEALGLWGQYLFDHMPKIMRLDLRTWSGNSGMMKLAEKLGFQQEACFRMARIVDEQYYDGLGYGILRSEWETRYPQGFLASLYTDGA